MNLIDKKLDSLSKSRFRSRFKLKDSDKLYIKKKGIAKIEEHAYDFISKRLASDNLINDGKQTPMKGHPVFIAQHATATCCRGCLYKWHGIDKNHKLSSNEINYIANIIMEWIKRELNK